MSLRERHAALGARFATEGGLEVPRHYGEPAAEYAAARDRAAVFDRAERTFLRVHGRDPVRMIQGLLTNDLSGAPADRAVYGAFLTPKGRMVADARVLREEGGALLLDVEKTARDALVAHLQRYVPPLFARVDAGPAGEPAMLGVYGPTAAAVLETVLGTAPPPAAAEHALWTLSWRAGEARVLRSALTGDPGGYDVIVPGAALPALWDAMIAAGARPAGHGALEVLRIEAGRPRWGRELDETVIPLEAGLRASAISETKGCYTGQEVIVRILHRGHVNRSLRGLLLGDVPAPASGAPLTSPDTGREVGRVTSACASPRLGQTIALAYVRREIEPDGRVLVGGDTEAKVVALPF